MELTLNNISKQYNKASGYALHHVDVTLKPGIYGLLGPNGAGKSTLMNILTDNITASEGEVLYNGTPIKKLGSSYRQLLGYMPQQQEIYRSFSGRRFLWYMAALKGMDKKKARQEIEHLIDVVNLRKDIHKKLGGYSGGMKQRILLAQAMLGNPSVLILDEPTAGLDPKERIRIRNYISEMATECIVLFATHVISDIEYIAEEIIMLKEGEVLKMDKPGNLLQEMEGKVYEVLVEKSQIKELERKYKISNISQKTDGIYVRLLAEQMPPLEKITKVAPTLEDLYLYHYE